MTELQEVIQEESEEDLKLKKSVRNTGILAIVIAILSLLLVIMASSILDSEYIGFNLMMGAGLVIAGVGYMNFNKWGFYLYSAIISLTLIINYTTTGSIGVGILPIIVVFVMFGHNQKGLLK